MNWTNIFDGEETFAPSEESVLDMITSTADEYVITPNSTATLDLENKIALSMAIRICAEQFMVQKINDMDFVDSIESNQTYQLLKRFQNDFDEAFDQIDVIKRVVLMTPENIHLNSFMYEPILDMSDEHLRKLYCAVKELI